MVIFPLAPDQTIAQMWSNGARGGPKSQTVIHFDSSDTGHAYGKPNIKKHKIHRNFRENFSVTDKQWTVAQMSHNSVWPVTTQLVTLHISSVLKLTRSQQIWHHTGHIDCKHVSKSLYSDIILLLIPQWVAHHQASTSEGWEAMQRRHTTLGWRPWATDECGLVPTVPAAPLVAREVPGTVHSPEYHWQHTHTHWNNLIWDRRITWI